jgi:hypothetical protein
MNDHHPNYIVEFARLCLGYCASAFPERMAGVISLTAWRSSVMSELSLLIWLENGKRTLAQAVKSKRRETHEWFARWMS